MGFFQELKRRQVYKVAVAYAVVAWLLIQIATATFPVLEIPVWATKLVIALIVLGFPLALIFAWAFELTPEGIKRTEEVGPGDAITRKTGRKLAALIAIVATLAAGLLTFQLLRPDTPKTAGGSSAIPGKSIAVLPFQNLSDDKTNAYFADGIQDQILTKLASVADLKVISRSSTAKYKSKPEDLKTVSQQLGVATVLEGTVQRAGDRVRVNVKLIDARADTHLWAKNYDRELKDVFAVQSEIAQEIADALRAKLSPSEARTLAVAPTRDSEAYDAFLKGEYEYREGESTLSPDPFDRAVGYYREALRRDPQFALAAAALVRTRVARHWFVTPLTAAELQDLKPIVEGAVATAPEVAETHLALGIYHYWGHRQYDQALEAFQRTLKLQPNSARARTFIGYVYRRRGWWEKSIAELLKATELDPRDPDIQRNLAGTHVNLRQWSDARRAAARTLALNPHELEAILAQVFSDLNGDGNIDGAQHQVANLPAHLRLTTNNRGTIASLIGHQTYLRVLKRDFATAQQELEKYGANDRDILKSAARAAICLLAGEGNGARAAAEEARPLLETRLRERPDDALVMSQLSWTYLALGQNAEAVNAARGAADSLPIELDALAGPVLQAALAEIQAHAGAPDAAVKTLRLLLAIPAGVPVSLNRLRIDPVWDPIRNEPEFQQLLAGKEQIGPLK